MLLVTPNKPTPKRWNYCPSDGQKIEASWKFCPACGTKINSPEMLKSSEELMEVIRQHSQNAQELARLKIVDQANKAKMCSIQGAIMNAANVITATGSTPLYKEQYGSLDHQ